MSSSKGGFGNRSFLVMTDALLPYKGEEMTDSKHVMEFSYSIPFTITRLHFVNARRHLEPSIPVVGERENKPPPTVYRLTETRQSRTGHAPRTESL